MLNAAIRSAANTPWLRWLPVWRRNALVWRKLAIPSMLAHFGEPLFYLFALGYGLGTVVGEMEGLPYIAFLTSGFLASSAMMTTSFEATYSAYARMADQKTWDAIISTPLDVEDVVAGEIIWAATKGVMSATAILLVAAAIGVVTSLKAVLALPVILLAGLSFGAMAMIVTAFARSYEFFLYYTTLVVTPMMVLSGVFFPTSSMPTFIQWLAKLLPLSHAVDVVRPLATGAPVAGAFWHLLVLAAYAFGAAFIASRQIRKRMHA